MLRPAIRFEDGISKTIFAKSRSIPLKIRTLLQIAVPTRERQIVELGLSTVLLRNYVFRCEAGGGRPLRQVDNTRSGLELAGVLKPLDGRSRLL